MGWLGQHGRVMSALPRSTKRLVIETLAYQSSRTYPTSEREREQGGKLIGKVATVITGDILLRPVDISDIRITEMFTSSKHHLHR